MNLQTYILNIEGIDWPILLREWSWILPRRFKVWIVNRFGDLFIIREDESVCMLDVSGGTFETLATSKEEFLTKIDVLDNARNWLMIPLVDDLVKQGALLKPKMCYGFSKPSILGGDYTIDNCKVSPLSEYLNAMAAIQKQLANVPDGTEVTIEIID